MPPTLRQTLFVGWIVQKTGRKSRHECVTEARDAPSVLRNVRGPAPYRVVTSRVLHAPRTLRSISAAETAASPLQRKANMSYTKLVSALARANSTSVNKMLVSPGRYRSTVASAKSQEERSRLDGCAVEAEPVELLSPTKPLAKAHMNQVNVDFDNTQEAYKSKRNIELLRSLLVFNLCAVDILVEKNKEVS